MIPRHCREVGVRKVAFPLTEANIAEHTAGKTVYGNTGYLLLNEGSNWAVIRIHKSAQPALFRKIDRAEIVSLPAETAYLDMPDADVQNASVMVSMLETAGRKAIVVKGKFEHMSFVSEEKSTPLVVFDVIPPNPPKIVELAEAALATGRIRKPIRLMPRIVDLNEVAQNRKTRYVMFPCYASSLTSGPEDTENVLYLDQAPRLEMPMSDLTLVGCDVSMSTFHAIYRQTPQFIDMCPKKVLRDSAGPGLGRCCRIDSGYTIEGDTAFLSWGASVADAEEAIIELFGLDLDNVLDLQMSEDGAATLLT